MITYIVLFITISYFIDYFYIYIIFLYIYSFIGFYIPIIMLSITILICYLKHKVGIIANDRYYIYFNKLYILI